jgi:hypothetical protein
VIGLPLVVDLVLVVLVLVVYYCCCYRLHPRYYDRQWKNLGVRRRLCVDVRRQVQVQMLELELGQRVVGGM